MPRDPAGPGPGIPTVRLEPLARRALAGWLLLGVGGLAVAGVLALMLAVARAPGAETWFPWAEQDSFRKILVSHVVFAFVLWFWAMLGALSVMARGSGRSGLIGLGLAIVGAAVILVTALAGRGEPALSNYIPVLLDPVFLGGLALFALGVAVPVGHLLIQPPHRDPTLAPGVASAGALFILALLCFAMAWRSLPPGADPYAHVDAIFWGGGHMLQFAYTALTLTAWQVLGAQAFGTAPLGRDAWRLVCALLVIAAVPGPILYMVMGGAAPGLRAAFTGLYTYGLPIPLAAGAIATIIRIWKGPRDWRSVAFLGVILSLAQFLFGGALGIFADGTDTRTPAHYHAEIGGVNLGLMALIFVLLLPALSRAGGNARPIRVQMWLYAVGQAVASAGLFIAGWVGVARKVSGAAEQLDTAIKKVGIDLALAGGVVAVAGGVLFIWLALRRLLARSALG
jgi:heme/copper-type cytochrome/quinol oxidase subunit 1